MKNITSRFSFKHAQFITQLVFVVLVGLNFALNLSATNSAVADIRQGTADAGPASAAVGNSIITTISNTDDFHVARLESNGFFDDITSAHWQRLKDIMAEAKDHKQNNEETINPKRSIEFWTNNYEPNFNCPFERRVGRPNGIGDGPKWICDPHRIVRLAKERKAKDPNHPGCVVFSIGSHGDFSFEYGMMDIVGNNTCEYHIFDVDDYSHEVPKDLGRAHFHHWGISTQQDRQNESDTSKWKPEFDAKGRKYFGLKDTIHLLGLENLDVIDIFKIDCEGCEYDTIKDWISPEVPIMQQIQVEIHGAQPKVNEFFRLLQDAGYARFHKESNIQYPQCIEYAFIKLDPAFLSITKEEKS